MFFQETIEGAQGYKVKDANKEILKAILKKHDGLEATCLFTDAALRTSLLYVDCSPEKPIKVCSRLQGEEAIEAILDAILKKQVVLKYLAS
ncbi:hypothetical protein Tco_0115984 [Tanacetum coccineum]